MNNNQESVAGENKGVEEGIGDGKDEVWIDDNKKRVVDDEGVDENEESGDDGKESAKICR